MIRDLNSIQQTVIGVFLSGKILKVGRVAHGVIEAYEYREIDNLATEEKILNIVIDSINRIWTDDVVGIGVGVPSLVDIKKGIVYNVEHIPSWREVHLGEILNNHFKVDISINNDANCFAIGEKYNGCAKRFNDVVAIVFGVGLGLGVITENRLYSGANCGTGELCSVPFKDHTYEYYCTTQYFQTKYGLTDEEVYARLIKQDKIAIAIIEEFGTNIGHLITTIMYMLDPECIVIGGNIKKYLPYIEPQIRKVLSTFNYQKSVEKIQILLNEKENVEVLGAAALYFNQNYKV